MAVLIGRYLNTIRTVIYEWEILEGVGPTYTPVLTLELGVAGGPITRVLLPGEDLFQDTDCGA